jgi:TonB family protein
MTRWPDDSSLCSDHESNADEELLVCVARCLHEYGNMHSDRVGSVSSRPLNRWFAVGLLLMGGWAATSVPQAWGQEELNRKPKIKVSPSYPELAKRMNISGVVKVLITVSPNGSIKDARLVGGHPVLATAALDAVKKWRFETGPQDSTGIVEFRFDPNQ